MVYVYAAIHYSPSLKMPISSVGIRTMVKNYNKLNSILLKVYTTYSP